MTKIVSRRLPNAISNADIGDPTVRNKVMLLQENIQSLSSQLAEAQKALVELQGGSSKVNLNGIAEQVAPLVEDIVVTESAAAYASASAAAASALAASGSATAAGESETNAGESETNAGNSATAAADSATDALNAKVAAEAARDRAEAAAETASWHSDITFANVVVSVTKNGTYGYYGTGALNLSAIVPDPTKNYVVRARFVWNTSNNTSTSTVRYFSMWTGDDVAGKVVDSFTASASNPASPGRVIGNLTKTVSGDSMLRIVGGSTSESGLSGSANIYTHIRISEA